MVLIRYCCSTVESEIIPLFPHSLSFPSTSLDLLLRESPMCPWREEFYVAFFQTITLINYESERLGMYCVAEVCRRTEGGEPKN